jgi:hypothetical protein
VSDLRRPAGAGEVGSEPGGAAATTQGPAPIATVEELIDFEIAAPVDRGAKARAVRRRFGCSTGRYYQELHRAIESERGLRYAPAVVTVLREQLETRRMRRGLNLTHVIPPVSTAPPNARPHRAPGGTMDGQVGMAFPPGEEQKQLGMARADEAAESAWKERVDDAIRLLAAGGGEFAADDIREISGDPPSHPNAMGARFYAMAKRGVIYRVGYRKSKRESLHAHPIAVWVGTRPEAGSVEEASPEGGAQQPVEQPAAAATRAA